MKLLKDYPLNEWMEAADGCPYCGAKNLVMVTLVDDSGSFGDITIKYRHEDSCTEPFDDQLAPDVEVVRWEFSDRTLKIAGKELPVLKVRMNRGVCVNCWKFITGIPIILFVDDHGEVDLCDDCANKLGILRPMRDLPRIM